MAVMTNAAVMQVVESESVPTEVKLQREVSQIEKQAKSIEVSTDEGYESAAAFVKEVKRRQKMVKEFFEPMRVKAKAAYDEVLGRKNEMTKPLEAAEKILKGKMSAYVTEKERQRKAQEERMRRLAAEESERKLREAVAAEAEGKADECESALTEAELMGTVAVTGTVAPQPVKAAGISVSRDWKITAVNSAKVPTIFNGVEIRPVDERAVLRLIKASKGTIQIPGIRYEETSTISVRS